MSALILVHSGPLCNYWISSLLDSSVGRLKHRASGEGVFNNRRTRITVETHRVVLIRDFGPAEALWCDTCRTRTRWMRPDQAAVIIDVSSRTIYRWVEENRLHFVDTPAGLLVCLESIGIAAQEPIQIQKTLAKRK